MGETWLDARLDRRLLRTFDPALVVMVGEGHDRWRRRRSELGAQIIAGDGALLGTRGRSNVLRSSRWRHVFLKRIKPGDTIVR